MFVAGIKGKDKVVYQHEEITLIEGEYLNEYKKIQTFWVEKYNDEVIRTHFTIPIWFSRYKKLQKLI